MNGAPTAPIHWARSKIMSRLVDKLMRSSQYLYDHVDGLLETKSIRWGGKNGDGKPQLCMPVHGEISGRSQPVLNENFQFSLVDLDLLDMCQLGILPELGSLSGRDGPRMPQIGLGQQQLSASRRPEGT